MHYIFEKNKNPVVLLLPQGLFIYSVHWSVSLSSFIRYDSHCQRIKQLSHHNRILFIFMVYANLTTCLLCKRFRDTVNFFTHIRVSLLYSILISVILRLACDYFQAKRLYFNLYVSSLSRQSLCRHLLIISFQSQSTSPLWLCGSNNSIGLASFPDKFIRTSDSLYPKPWFHCLCG